MYLLAQIAQKHIRFRSMQGFTRGELDTELLFESLDHVVPLPWALEVKGAFLPVLAFWLVGEGRVATSQVLYQPLDQALGEIHDVVHVRIGHVKLADGEFGVMREVNALVPKNAANLVHSIQTTNDELLEIQLWCNAEVQVEIEVIMVGNKRFGGCATSDHTGHRSFDLKKAQRVKEAADVVDDTTASIEYTARVFGENKIEVALAIPRLLVLKAEVAGGKLVQIWSKEDHLRGRDREFPFLGA